MKFIWNYCHCSQKEYIKLELNDWSDFSAKSGGSLSKDSEILNFIKKFSDLPVLIQTEIGNSTWFGFSIIFNDVLEGKRDYMVQKFMENGIECRPIVAGNFAKSDVVKYFDREIHDELKNANWIDKNGLFIGNHHMNMKEAMECLEDI